MKESLISQPSKKIDLVAHAPLQQRRNWRNSIALPTLYFALAIGGLIFFVLPLYWMIATALKPESQVISIPPVYWPTHIDWSGFKDILSNSSLLNSLKNSIILTVIPVIGDTLSAALVAYAFARLKAPGSKFLFYLMLGSIMIPFQVTVLPQFILFNALHWVDTFLPLIVPSFFGTAFNIFLLRQFFLSIPRELDEAARLDGMNHLGIFWHIIVPLSKPALAAVAIFSFVYHWNDFFYPLIYLNSQQNYPIPYALAQYAAGAYGNAQFNHLFALGLISALPCLLLFFFAQRYFIRGLTVTGGIGK